MACCEESEVAEVGCAAATGTLSTMMGSSWVAAAVMLADEYGEVRRYRES